MDPTLDSASAEWDRCDIVCLLSETVRTLNNDGLIYFDSFEMPSNQQEG